MRHTRIAVIILCLMMLSLWAAPALSDSVYPYRTVTLSGVNMRRSASASALVLERLDAGESVEVLSKSGSYYKVSARGRTGYVLGDYLQPAAAMIMESAVTAVPETVESYPYETTTRDKVNLREKASTGARLLDQIPAGDTLRVKSVTGDWARVSWNGKDGYVNTQYLYMKTVTGKAAKATASPTPVPTLTPDEQASYYFVLSEGSSGEAVTALQNALIELGYLRAGTADGRFGSATRKAVLAFQKKNDYPQTGIVDANMQAFLYSGKPLNSKGTKTTVNTLPPVPGVTLRLNHTGDLVGQLQIRLTALGYYKGSITMIYDSATQKAVKAFQKKNGLSQQAYCDSVTQNAIFSDAALAVDATPTPKPTATPTPVPTFQVPSGTVRQGSSGEDARRVQQRLKDLGYLTGKVDGQFGSASVAALKAFQTNHRLQSDGIAGNETIAWLFSYDALDAKATPLPEITPTPAPTAVPTLPPITKETAISVKLGTAGDIVYHLQTRLTELGYYQATTDGVCKEDDVAAIRAFQEKNGLKTDGIAGYDTQVKLFSASAIAYTSETRDAVQKGYTVLRKGMTGDAVRALQERLIALKYLYGKADGVYGTTTAEAVATFQKTNGLSMDGIAGEKTQTRLFSTSAIARAAATATPRPTATPVPVAEVLKKGDTSAAVRSMQEKLIALGYLSGNADGVFGVRTYQALVAFQEKNRLTADGIAGEKTLAQLASSSAVAASTDSLTQTVVAATVGTSSSAPKASQVKYANWYSTVKEVARKYPYATVYDFSTGISWQVHIFSLGAHADAEPLTANDTARMQKAFGGQTTWAPKAVWVVFSDGSVYIGSTHDTPHSVEHITDNNFAGHLCIHFPRTDAQVTAIGSYARAHQSAIDIAWAFTQSMQ